MPKCPRNTLRRMFRSQQPTTRLSSKADLLVARLNGEQETDDLPSQIYLNYVKFIEAVAKEASAAAQLDSTPIEDYHVQDVVPVSFLCMLFIE